MVAGGSLSTNFVGSCELQPYLAIKGAFFDTVSALGMASFPKICAKLLRQIPVWFSASPAAPAAGDYTPIVTNGEAKK
jgi:hypothetical protein